MGYNADLILSNQNRNQNLHQRYRPVPIVTQNRVGMGAGSNRYLTRFLAVNQPAHGGVPCPLIEYIWMAHDTTRFWPALILGTSCWQAKFTRSQSSEHSRETFSIIYYLCRAEGGGSTSTGHMCRVLFYVACQLTNLQPAPDEL